jgi:phage gp29-like protein
MRVEQSVIRDRLGIADPDHNAALLHPLGAAPVEHGAANVAAQSTRVAAHAQQPDQPDAIDALIAEELADWEPLVSPLIAPLHALLAECESLEEFQRRLPELVQDQDPDTLAEAMAQALFVARLSGETADG